MSESSEVAPARAADGVPHHLVYTSRCVFPGSADARAANLADIVVHARCDNAAAGLTSVLAYYRGGFAQAVEGTAAAVAALLDHLRRDARHDGMRVLGHGPAEGRRLPDRPLVLVGHDARSRAVLAPVLDRIADEAAPADADILMETLRQAAEAAQGESPEARPGEPRGAGLDVGSLRTALTGLLPGRPRDRDDPAVPEPTPEMEAFDAIYATALLSVQGTVLRANAGFHALLGYPAGTLAGTAYRDLLHEDDAGRLDKLWAALDRGETVKVDRRGLRRDGTEVWLRSAYRPRFGADGALIDVVEMATDFTQQQLRQSGDRGQILAINRAMAVAHFALDGTILDANDLFLGTMGYARDEIVGRHHSLLAGPEAAARPDYAAFWAALGAGQHASAEYRRFTRDGRPVWLQATYNVIFDMGGRPFKVVTYATDITAEKLRQADYQWQIAAIHKSHAVITFDMNGIILDANDLFLETMGYALDEIVGHHHRMFVDPSYVHGPEYATFWRDLGRGRHQSGQYRRLDRAGREIWLQATYNPIFDTDGHPAKVVKYATVVTAEKLRQAEHQGQIAAIHKAQVVISFDLDGTILDANDNFLDAVGYRLSEVRGRHHRMFVEPAEAEGEAYGAFWQQLAAGRHQSGEYRRVGRDGREVWLQATYNPIFDMRGRPFRIVKYAIDITAEKLRQADIDGQMAAINRAQGVVTFDLDGRLLDANAIFLETFGYARAELVGHHHSVLVAPAQAAAPEYRAFWETLRAGTFLSGRFERVAKDGRAVWLQATYNPIFDLNGRPSKIVGYATDVTGDVAMAEAYEDAARQAQHDPTTSLPNRKHLAAYMVTALAHPTARVAVFYLDLDRFKPINDTFGHHVGDRVLGEVADRLRRVIAREQLAARVGGDEFVVVAPGLCDDAVEALCHELLDAVGAPIHHEAGALKVGVSIGVAVSPTDGRTPDELLRAADAALYRAKRNGRGTYCYYAAAMNERIDAYRTQVADIRRGLDAGEFFLEYQPRFKVLGEQVQSVEALVRWSHPERGRVSPGDFVPLAEKSGLIAPLGEWVLRTACRTAMGWDGIGVSVNVSPVQFRNCDIVGLVTAALEETGLDPRRLELEITEGVLLEDADRARAALEGLKRLGVRLAMDDFGTGYSSLSSLRSFPFDVIKIDRQFVADLEGRDGGRDVVRAILGLGKALSLTVTAEGVETAGQLAMLADDACEEVQGYHLARPMAAAQVSDLLDAARRAKALPEALRTDAA